MHLINNQLFYNLETYLDMQSFDSINDKICIALAKNYNHFRPSGTSQDTLYDQSTVSVYKKRDDVLKSELANQFKTQAQALFYAKLAGTVTLGTNFVLRGNIGYPATYSKKHMHEFSQKFEFDEQFKFLFDWIDAQGCFTEYGRVIFWINEPNQKTAFHRDYPTKTNAIHKDPFIWLTGVIPKRLVLLDDVTKELHYSTSRACVFNTNNIHSSIGNTTSASWSLRIDGAFNPAWAKNAGIAEYFGIS